MSIEWITHKGKRILYMKFEGLSFEEQVELIKKGTQFIVESKTKDNLTLIDLTNSFISDKFLEATKENSKITQPMVKKSAVVGIVGVKKILFRAVNSLMKNPRSTFDTVEEAKEWLVE